MGKKSAPIHFDVAAATVDPMTPEFNPAPLTAYLKELGVEYHMLSKPIIEMAKTHMDPKRPSLCAFCSRMKRGMLYSCMREKGYNVLVLGQHLDDFAESFFMSAIHNGLLRTMKANYWVQQEDVRVCRPLLYVRESLTALFAKENALPIISDNCPACFAAPKERHKTKVLLSSLEFDYPQLFSTLLRTMRPLYALETADRANGVVADEDDVGPPTRGAVANGGDKIVKKRLQACDEDAAAELVLSACGPSAAGDAIPSDVVADSADSKIAEAFADSADARAKACDCKDASALGSESTAESLSSVGRAEVGTETARGLINAGASPLTLAVPSFVAGAACAALCLRVMSRIM